MSEHSTSASFRKDSKCAALRSRMLLIDALNALPHIPKINESGGSGAVLLEIPSSNVRPNDQAGALACLSMIPAAVSTPIE